MKYTCKYCLEEDFIQNLIHPCKCKGSMKYVHPKCFYKWQKSSCEICHYSYQFKTDPVVKMYIYLYSLHHFHLYLLYIGLWKCIPYINFYDYNTYLCEFLIAIQLHYLTIIKDINRSYTDAVFCLFLYYTLLYATQFMYVWLANILLSVYGFLFCKLHIYTISKIPVYNRIINYNI